MGASQHDADSLYLVLAYLSSEPCRVKAVQDGCGSATDTIGEQDKFSVEVRPCRVGVLRLYGSFDVGRHAIVRSF